MNLGDPVRVLLLPVLAAVGLGTYLARGVPFLLALKGRAARQPPARPRRLGAEPRAEEDAGRGSHPAPAGHALASHAGRAGAERQPRYPTNPGSGAAPPAAEGGWLELVAPSVMAALLVGSLLPARWGPEAIPLLARHLVALAAAWAVARRYRHLGLTVLVGMAVAWLASAAVAALRSGAPR